MFYPGPQFLKNTPDDRKGKIIAGIFYTIQNHSLVQQELRICREARLQGPAGFNANRRMRKSGCCSDALSDP